MLFSMAISLYTSRIVLEILGVEDYGIYSVVGGVVTIFSFINSSMSSATQRFLSFELGKQNLERLKNVFSSALNIHILTGILIIILGETFGMYFLLNYLNIPPERLDIAIIVFQFSLFSTFLRILQVPYNASIMANEKMDVFAYVSIFEVVLRLSMVIMLSYIDVDKLMLYSILIFTVILFTTSFLKVYCIKKFKECSFKIVRDKELYKELLSYSGWSLFGNMAAVSMSQGINILLNIFFSPAVNAARSVSYQVSGAIQSFASNFQAAVNPQIVKSYAMGDNDYMTKLIFASARITFYLLFFLALPILLETNFVLHFWLKEVPDLAVLFTFLIIINTLIDSVSGPLRVANQATGKIKNFQVIVGSTLMLNLPISYLFLKLGFPAQIVFYIGICISLICLYLRLYLIQKQINFSIKNFYNDVLKKIIIIISLSIISPLLCINYLEEGIFRFIIVSLVSSLSIIVFTYFFGVTHNEKELILNKIKSLIQTNKTN